MTETVYVNGTVVNGVTFPSVSVYSAVLEAQGKNVFDTILKSLLPESTVAVVDENGAVLVINGSNIRIHFTQPQVQSPRDVRGVRTALVKG